jgi:zinc protease
MKVSSLLVAGALLSPATLTAQTTASFDRTKPPALGKTPTLHLPAIQRSTLANGVGIQLVGQHEVPLVQVTLVIDGGSRLDGAQPGLAGFSSRMLTEAAGTRDANALQSELAFIGATLNTGALADVFIVSLNVPKRSLGAALDLMADVTLRPQFRAADIRRQRDLALAGILQRKDQPTQIASLAFNQIIFPAGHPYHNSSAGDSASIASIDSARVRAFYNASFVSSRARFIVVGDVGKAELESLLASRFSAWKSGATPLTIPTVSVQPRSNASTQLYLVDKPGAAQSVVYIGNPGADRRSPDYPAISVMNTILGGSFSARLMSNLRETKGYTYGVSSSFRWAPVAGPFAISSSVRTNVTDSSLVEIFKELRAIRETPVSTAELDRAKAYIALALPARFETNAEIAGQLVDLGTFSLPLSSVRDFGARVNAVTAADVQRVARQYMQADRETIVVVGDLAKIRAGIEALKLGTITVLDVGAVAR